MYECVYTKRSKNTNEILPNHSRQLSPLQILPRRIGRSPKAQKLTREAGGKIVRPTFRLLRSGILGRCGRVPSSVFRICLLWDNWIHNQPTVKPVGYVSLGRPRPLCGRGPC